jgi:hypothetical protein
MDIAMKNLVMAALMGLSSTQALACPLSQSLAERYGISFSGFRTAIPETKSPETGTGGQFVRVRVPDDSNVSDGFHHTIVLDLTTKKAWILRTGGFASVYQWYGPVDVINASIENCQLEPTLHVADGPQKR